MKKLIRRDPFTNIDNMRLNIGRENINNLRFVDGTLVKGENADDLERILKHSRRREQEKRNGFLQQKKKKAVVTVS